ncbi:MAG: tRNA (adenosine(37)-N6)-threonylcarbamoyltransferase complex ATPase subunit type 1 TsaE [Chitinophagaceae bacterium]|nr:tRNA (adenosine(37)-N6)-threonylcarbamoyltransferase complex ATPase subunit type 1 TsaE [Chitinophagaceae bacterium]
MEWVFSLDEIQQAAADFWKTWKGKPVFAFSGEMGAGKTTFIHALCRLLGVKDAISSPTFSLINEYQYDCEGTKRPLFHIDLYRIKDEEEAIRAGMEDVLHSGHLCFAEWPEKAPGIFPPDKVNVLIQIVENNKRRISVQV